MLEHEKLCSGIDGSKLAWFKANEKEPMFSCLTTEDNASRHAKHRNAGNELKWTSDVNTLGPRQPVPYIKECKLSCERLRNNKGDSIWRRFNAEISESNRPKIWNTNEEARWLRSGTIIIETECDIPNNRKAKPNHLTPLQTWATQCARNPELEQLGRCGTLSWWTCWNPAAQDLM